MKAAVVNISIFQFAFAALCGAAADMPATTGALEAAAGPGAMIVRCRFSGEKPQDRGSAEIPFRHDLSKARGISFDLTAENLGEFSNFICYLRSGKGWYSRSFVPGEEGRKKRITIDKASVGIEGVPGGWNLVDHVRVSGWRGGTNDAAFAVGAVAVDTNASDIVVFQAQSCISRSPSEAKSCMDFAGRMAGSLQRIGLDCCVMSDLDFNETTLDGVKMVFLPYNPRLPDNMVKPIEDFLSRGGKIFAAYSCDSRIFKMMGLSYAGFEKAPSGNFGGFVRNGKGLEGQPEFAAQRSWFSVSVKTNAESEVVAWWGEKGRPLPLPALVRCKNGFYMGHVWLGGMSGESRALLRSMVVSMAPEKKAVIDAALAAAERRARADEEWVASLPTSSGKEFRAFWCHSPLGLGGGRTWDESISFLKKGGFNTIIANLAWGGSADYPSKVLPRSTTGLDAFAACKAACLKHGVRFHVWKVCWNLGNGTPPEFMKKLKEEGRLQVSYSGKETRWLCPTHPANQKMESDAFLEMAKKGPDGVHFDYIRYPGNDSCFCSGCRERFEKKYGAVEKWPEDLRRKPDRQAQWEEFKREAIGSLVRDVARRVRAEAPGVEISAAVFSNFESSARTVGQDWPAWCREGLLDFVCPMDYIESTAIFSGVVARQKRVVGKVPVYPGIGLSTGAPDGRLRRVAEQIMACRAAGCSGFTVFNFDSAAEETLPILSRGPTRVQASSCEPRGERPSGRIELFNGRDLENWYVYLKGRGRSDPRGVFSVKDGVLRVSGAELGCITTLKSWRDYRLTVEYRFTEGAPDAPGRKSPDSGILYHSQGADGVWNGIWMRSFEYNLIVGKTGDMIVVSKRNCDAPPEYRVTAEVDDLKLAASRRRWMPGGSKVTLVNTGRVNSCVDRPDWRNSPDERHTPPERPYGEWNTAVLECRGNTSAHILNGVPLARFTDLSPDEGRIQIQSEGYGCEFRRITIEPL